jgi:hypothetical protein
MNTFVIGDYNMIRRTFFTLLVLLLAAGFGDAADKPEVKSSTPPASATNSASVQIIAYYFHGTVRCETCQKIERQAREIIEQRFKTELAAKRLAFKPVNYDLKENAHFQTDYKLPCPSLVLVRQQDGKDEKWKLLGETWKLVKDTAKFHHYVESEIGRYLQD